jgi:hypothetical protein
MTGSQASVSMLRKLVGFFRSEKFIKIESEKFGARDSRHFLEISVDENDLGTIVRNNHAFIQGLKDAFDLLQPFRLLDVHGTPLYTRMLPKRDQTTNAHFVAPNKLPSSSDSEWCTNAPRFME